MIKNYTKKFFKSMGNKGFERIKNNIFLLKKYTFFWKFFYKKNNEKMSKNV